MQAWSRKDTSTRPRSRAGVNGGTEKPSADTRSIELRAMIGAIDSVFVLFKADAQFSQLNPERLPVNP